VLLEYAVAEAITETSKGNITRTSEREFEKVTH